MPPRGVLEDRREEAVLDLGNHSGEQSWSSVATALARCQSSSPEAIAPSVPGIAETTRAEMPTRSSAARGPSPSSGPITAEANGDTCPTGKSR